LQIKVNSLEAELQKKGMAMQGINLFDKLNKNESAAYKMAGYVAILLFDS
jgi:hypothetical protein